MPVGKYQVKIQRCFSSFPAIKNFIYDQESHAIGKVEQFRCRWIMCQANGIATKITQDFELTLSRAYIECSAQCTEVMMLIHTLDTNRFSIYHHTFQWIK